MWEYVRNDERGKKREGGEGGRREGERERERERERGNVRIKGDLWSEEKLLQKFKLMDIKDLSGEAKKVETYGRAELWFHQIAEGELTGLMEE